MAIDERYYERYLHTQWCFELIKEARSKRGDGMINGDYEKAAYWEGYADGIDKCFSIMLQLLEKEVKMHKAELENLKNELCRPFPHWRTL